MAFTNDLRACRKVVIRVSMHHDVIEQGCAPLHHWLSPMADQQSQSQKDPSLLHLPPQSIEAEESLLSAILVDNNTLLDVVEILSAADFYRSAHQKIFAAIMDLFDRGEPVDLVTLANNLKEKGHLDAIGGASYLARLVDAVPVAVNAQHYAKIVADKASLQCH